MDIVEMIENSKEEEVFLTPRQAISLAGIIPGNEFKQLEDGTVRLADYAGKKLFIDLNKIDESNLLKS